jgi:D-arabinose 1-dehydrogenase-like Zn-dependent alcohol dehydrogenase
MLLIAVPVAVKGLGCNDHALADFAAHPSETAEPHACAFCAGAEEFAIGDEVFGVAPGSFGATVVVPAQLLVPKPPRISFVEAATTPTTYVTVYSAFGGLTALEAGTKACIS